MGVTVPAVPDLATLARDAFRVSGRPRGGSLLVVADALGFRLLPCAPDSSPEFERTSATRIAWAADPDPAVHAVRLSMALARGLLIRDGRSHHAGDIGKLARMLREFP